MRLDILLSNIPYRVTQTWTTHVVFLWITVSALSLMILVLVACIVVKYPHTDMPVGLTTLAGMYYICDSHFLQDIDHDSRLSYKEREKRIKETGQKFRFGKMVGVSGETGMGVDYADHYE